LFYRIFFFWLFSFFSSFFAHFNNFDRANAEIEKNMDNEIFKGVILIQNKFKDILTSKGLSLIEVKKGDKFNADNHEAVTQIEAPSAKLKGKIIDVIEKGYKLGVKHKCLSCFCFFPFD
jgi:molecular chaperone GrpE